jgi:hypothetical protein
MVKVQIGEEHPSGELCLKSAKIGLFVQELAVLPKNPLLAQEVAVMHSVSG